VGFARVQFKVGKDNPLQDLVWCRMQCLKVLAEDTKIFQETLQELLKALRRKDQLAEPREGRGQIL
jgi:hypothetical protein